MASARLMIATSALLLAFTCWTIMYIPEPIRILQAMEVEETSVSTLLLQKKRTAVVWTTEAITSECEASRVRHLVETAGVGMEVWVLHAHRQLAKQGRHKDVETSRSYIASIPGLHHTEQTQDKYVPFDAYAGSSKNSFLWFLAEHANEYDHAWIVENDLFYTGPWEEILIPEMEADSTTDFLSVNILDASELGYRWYWIRPEKNECVLFQHQCVDFKVFQCGWMFARVSTRFATSLIRDVVEGNVRGHHEAIVAPYCSFKNFTYGSLADKSKVGAINYGHQPGGDQTKMDVASFDPQPGKLLHAVKCDAYGSNKTMENDIQTYCKKTSSERAA